MNTLCKTLRAVGLALVLTLALSGCGDAFGPGQRSLSFEETLALEKELSSGPTGRAALDSRHANRERQVEWAVPEANEALSILGQDDGWFDLDYPDRTWSDVRERDVKKFYFGGCGLPETDPWGIPLRSDEHLGGRLQLTLIHNNFSDTYAAAERLRSHWKWEGWQITDFYSGVQPNGERLEFFRADEPGGAALVLNAKSTSLVLEVLAACSSAIPF